jgi:3-phosphoshikimate 1-carboxyvinyltransferase
MGAGVREDLVDEVAGEPVGAVTVRAAPLSGTTVTAGEVPTLLDEIPLLAAIAARAEGESRFEGVGELRVKESDRIRAMEVNLRALGVETRAGPDHLAVVGTRRPLRGRVEAFGDHRIAMAFGVLAALPDSEIQIAGSDVVAVSYPAFWDELERIRTELAEA